MSDNLQMGSTFSEKVRYLLRRRFHPLLQYLSHNLGKYLYLELEINKKISQQKQQLRQPIHTSVKKN